MSDLKARIEEARRRFGTMCANPVALDLTRGKPSAEQLDLSRELLTILGPQDFAMDVTSCLGERLVGSCLRRCGTATLGTPGLLSSFSLGRLHRECSRSGCLPDDPIRVRLRIFEQGSAHGVELGS